MEISLSQGKGNLLDRLPKGRQISESKLYDAFNTSTGKLWRKVLDNTPTSTGTLAKSITRELTPTYAKIYPQLGYGLFVHEGTKPHGIPKRELLPGGTLYRWAQKKGISPYAVARAIARKGTKANPWMARTSEQEAENVFKEFERALDDIVQALA